MLRFQEFRISISAVDKSIIFPPQQIPLVSHRFKPKLLRFLLVGRFEDKRCCRSMVFTSGILRVFQELERTQKKPLGKTMSDSWHVGMLEQFESEDVFSGRCCYKTSLISSTGALECWNVFRKDKLFTGKRNAKKRSRFLLASLLSAMYAMYQYVHYF